MSQEMENVLIPSDPRDLARWVHTAVRLRMLEGHWESDIIKRLSEKLTPNRNVNLGRPTQSLNLFQSAVRQISIQHDDPCTFSNPLLTESATDIFNQIVSSSHIHSILQKNSEYVVGLRENLIRIDYTADGIQLHIATPNTIVTEHAVGNPNKMIQVKEMTHYLIEGEWEPCWSIWDISNPARPTFRVENDDGDDVTSSVILPEMSGEGEMIPTEWIWFDSEGQPFLPWVKYRAQYTCHQWDAYAWSELAHASIDVAILWTAWNKVVLDASWAQRWVIDLMIQGMSQTVDGTATIECDPTSIIALKSNPDKAGSTGQWEPASDPEKLAIAIQAFQSSVLSNIGIHPADIDASQNTQSGVAIQLKRSAQRRLAMKMIPQFRDGDTELLEKIAMVYNIVAGSDVLPVEEWSIQYHLPAADVGEFIAELDRDARLLEMGFISKVDLMMKYNPDLSRDQAIEKLRLVASENQEFAQRQVL
jgi:hypothetical protein